MKRLSLLTGLIFFFGILLIPLVLAAPAEVTIMTIKGLGFERKLDDASIEVKSVDGTAETLFKIVRTIETKVEGGLREVTLYDDWMSGDPLSVVGVPNGYEGGMLKVTARTITYNGRGFYSRSFSGNLVNKDTTGDKIFIAVQSGNQYVLPVVERAAAAVRSTGGIEALKIGDRVFVRELWRTVGKKQSKIKTLEVKKVNGSPEVVVSIVKNSSGYALEDGYSNALQLSRGDKLWIQNTSGDPLYVRLGSMERANFVGINSEYIRLSPRSKRLFTIQGPRSDVTSFTLRITTQNEDSPSPVISIPLKIAPR